MKNRTFNYSMTALSVALALGLTGCLGGSDDKPLDTTLPTPKVTQGVITGFGSVFVNGVEYETDVASINVDGLAGNETQLKLGMVVKLKGSVNADGSTGNALSVDFADNLEGTVAANNIGIDNTLTVMGQTVTITADTVFESSVAGQLSPADIAAGNIVEISGFTSGDGNIFATRVEVKKQAHVQGDEIQLKGLISMLDSTAKTFKLGGMTIDYNQAAEVPAVIANGLYVEAKTTSAPAGNTFVASKIEVEGNGELGVEVAENEDIELSGMITSVGTPSLDGLSVDFTINGQLAKLVVEEAGKMAEESAKLVVGAKARIEGKGDATGVLIVNEIDSGMGDSDLEIKGFVDSVDVANKSVTILGQTIYLTNNTMVKDDLDVGAQRYFGVDDLVNGDWIEVKLAIDAATGNLVALNMKRDDASGNTEELKGKIVDNTTTLGHMIIGDASLAPTMNLDVLSNATGFAAGDKVVITVTENGGVLTATNVILD
ncbi:MAG: DUF5666 domain-containing protein [Gammaproteobacteria bacterium]|nr:DUF5666 domain-containing protein [Gammaproteobacteria bacterium]